MVGFGNGLHDGQAEPEPAGLAAAVWFGAGEAAEDVVQVGRRHAAAGVGHGDDRVGVLEADADLDAVARLGPETTAELVTVLAPLAQACASVVPYPSPIGVPAPSAAR